DGLNCVAKSEAKEAKKRSIPVSTYVTPSTELMP
ncbi:hypothetical protein JMJ77_0007447, partial [Colletotrichum scovillei]